MKARITEIFDSIQGEGIYLGERQLFVRFFGCNLSCKFCDTKPGQFVEYEPHELLDEIRLHGDVFHSLSFTGGEPLLQKDFLKEVVTMSAAYGHMNYLETNGTLYAELKDVIKHIDIVAMDIKLPSSTGMSELWTMHQKFLEIASLKEVFVKTIISEETKESDLRKAAELMKKVNSAAILVLQPNSFQDIKRLKNKLEECRGICMENRITSCVIPQMHKIVGIK